MVEAPGTAPGSRMSILLLSTTSALYLGLHTQVFIESCKNSMLALLTYKVVMREKTLNKINHYFLLPRLPKRPVPPVLTHLDFPFDLILVNVDEPDFVLTTFDVILPLVEFLDLESILPNPNILDSVPFFILLSYF